ncbi:winged helix-turn-helix domain-containing protein [Lentisalinibacter salinarum]|uniref:winged helix-turn-helix domain-containing protein n=1 Tax=Lentisalinibacter salinarum TaxID=2992239 RepID=UPI00386572E1
MTPAGDFTRGFLLGSHTVLPDRGEIVSASGEARHVEPKVMDVLLCLVGQKGELVTKQQLVDAVWDGRPVTDEVIARCISALRGHLGDDHKSPKFVETLPKRGYRLIAEVAPLEPGQRTETAPRSKRSLGRLAAVFIPVMAAIGWWVLQDGGPQRASNSIESIAVLPFTNMSAEDMQYLADGVTEELTYALALEPRLKVAARTTAFQFRNTALDVREIGDLIEVDSIIEGSVRREGDRLRVTAQLIDARSGYHLWVASFDGRIDDVFRLQRQVADRVRESIGSGEIDGPAPVRSEPASFVAYDLYLRGRYALHLRGSPALERAIGQFREAIALDPGFGPAYLELANALLLLPSYSSDYGEDSYDDALRVIEQGMQADPAIADAAAAVNGYIATKRGQWLAADRAYQTALGAPQASSTTHQWYSYMLASVGRFDDAREQARQARRLDPLSPVVVSRLAILNLWADDDAVAAEQFAVANELGIRSSLHNEAQLLLLVRRGEIERARELMRQASQGALPVWLDAALDCVGNSNRCDEATAAIEGEQGIPPRVRLIAWAVLGRSGRVAEVAGLLATDIDAFEPELLFIRELSGFRSDPAFDRLLDATGIRAYWAEAGCRRVEDHVACGSAATAGVDGPYASSGLP